MESFEQLCQIRRSIRKYKSQPIEQEKIDYMLRCALMSPSAKRTIPWEFVVVRDEAKVRALSVCKTYGAQMFDTATAAIIIALDPTLCHNTWMADGAIAAEHILLAAAEQGVGACWCHIHERGKVVTGDGLPVTGEASAAKRSNWFGSAGLGALAGLAGEPGEPVELVGLEELVELVEPEVPSLRKRELNSSSR